VDICTECHSVSILLYFISVGAERICVYADRLVYMHVQLARLR